MGTISLTNIANGDALDGTVVDNNFDAIANEFNGNVDTVNLKDAAVSTVKVAADAVTAAKMINGQILSRQGSSATVWATPGTTTYDVSATDVKFQVGSATSASGGAVTVMFPTAYTYAPVVLCTKATTTGSNFVFAEVSSITTTSFDVNVSNVGGSRVAANVCWLAIGV